MVSSSSRFLRLSSRFSREMSVGTPGRDHRQRTTAHELGLPPALHATIYATSLTPMAWRRVGAIMQRPASEFRAASDERAVVAAE